jgi:hypothetical protein
LNPRLSSNQTLPLVAAEGRAGQICGICARLYGEAFCEVLAMNEEMPLGHANRGGLAPQFWRPANDETQRVR